MALNYGFEVFAIAVDGMPCPGWRVPITKSIRTSTILVRYDCPHVSLIRLMSSLRLAKAISLDELNNEIILAPIKPVGLTIKLTMPPDLVRTPACHCAMSAQELNEKILQDPEFLVRYLRARGGL